MINWINLQVAVLPFLKMLLILVAGHFAIVYVLKLFKKALQKSKIDPSLTHFFVKTVNIVLHLLVILSALNSIGVSTNGIIAALSASVFAVSVALKDSLGNVAGGILLLLSPRFLTGDYILAGGKEGSVVKVDLLHTTIKTLDGKVISIPNGVLINEDIVNYSKEEKRRVDMIFPVPYDCDIKEVKRIALETVNKHELVLSQPDAPFVRVGDYGDSAVNVVVRVWCKTEDYWTVRFDLTEQIREAFVENKIDIPYNQLDVHIKDRI